MSFLTVAREAEHEEVMKGSRFVARVMRVGTVEKAMTRLEQLRARFADATHNCWAYRIGQAYRFSDDGEPGGTAGRPMLEVLARRDLQQVLAVVTRYYGGTKLGAGGLVRAYGGTLAKALDAAGVVEIRPRCMLHLAVPFAHMDSVHRLLDDWPGLDKGEVSFDSEGMRQRIGIFLADRASFIEALANLTRGAATVTEDAVAEGTPNHDLS